MAERKVAVIILTFNEEKNLPHALESVVGWAKEIYVVDSFSTDKTVDIALSYEQNGVWVVQHAFENYSAQWNWALTHLPIVAEWTLKLDADERATPAFCREVDDKIGRVSVDVHGFYFKRILFFMGQPLHHGGYSDNYVLHLWRTGKAVFEDRSVNEHALIRGRSDKLQSVVEHHDFKSISDWIAKHNRYSSLEAINMMSGNVNGGISPRLLGSPDERRMFFRHAYRKIPARAFLYFLYRFVFRLAILDGMPGFRYTFLHACYRYWTELKIIEAEIRNVVPEIVWPPRGTPHPVVVSSRIQMLVTKEQETP